MVVNHHRRSALVWHVLKGFHGTVTLKPMLEVTQVIGNDTHQSATYDFQLTFQSNYWPILHHFQDKQRSHSNITKFSHPHVFYAPADGVPLGTGYWHMGQKTE